jgi:hypothetical protein
MAHIKKGLISGRPAYNSGGLSLTIGSTVSGGTRGAVAGRSGKIIPKSNDFYFVNTDQYYGFDGNRLLNFVFTEPTFTKYNSSFVIDNYNDINMFLINTSESSVTADILANIALDDLEEFNFIGLNNNVDPDNIPKFICFEKDGNVNNNIIKELKERLIEIAKIFVIEQVFENIGDNPSLEQILELLKPYISAYQVFLIKNSFLTTINANINFNGFSFYLKLLANSIVFKKYGEQGSKLTIYSTQINNIDTAKQLISKYKKIDKVNETTINITDLQSTETSYTIVKSDLTTNGGDVYLSNTLEWVDIENSNDENDFAFFTNSASKVYTIYNFNKASSLIWTDLSKKMYVNVYDGKDSDHLYIPQIDTINTITYENFTDNTDGTYSCLFEIDETSMKLIKSTKSKEQLITDDINSDRGIIFYEFVVISNTTLTTNDTNDLISALTNYSGTAYILTKINSKTKTAEITTIKNTTITPHSMVVFYTPPPAQAQAQPKSLNWHGVLKTQFSNQLQRMEQHMRSKQLQTIHSPIRSKQLQTIHPPILSKEEIRKNKIREKISAEIEKRRLQSTKNKEIRIKESKQRIKDEKEKRQQSKIRTDEQLDKLIERRIEKMIKDGSIERLINKSKTKI